ncbi:unnamed protein product [Gadus morhua 'NCC']
MILGHAHLTTLTSSHDINSMSDEGPSEQAARRGGALGPIVGAPGLQMNQILSRSEPRVVLRSHLTAGHGHVTMTAEGKRPTQAAVVTLSFVRRGGHTVLQEDAFILG